MISYLPIIQHWWKFKYTSGIENESAVIEHNWLVKDFSASYNVYIYYI